MLSRNIEIRDNYFYIDGRRYGVGDTVVGLSYRDERILTAAGFIFGPDEIE